MRTARSFTVWNGSLRPPPQEGRPFRPRGADPPAQYDHVTSDAFWKEADPPTPKVGQTDACENIIFARFAMRAVIKSILIQHPRRKLKLVQNFIQYLFHRKQTKLSAF